MFDQSASPNQRVIDEVVRLLGDLARSGRGDDCVHILSWARQEIDEIYAWEKTPASRSGGLMGYSLEQGRRWQALLNTLLAKLATSDCVPVDGP